MSGLADLFSETSPPPPSPGRSSPRRSPPRRSPTTTPPRRRHSSNPLFLSPSDTPEKAPLARDTRTPTAGPSYQLSPRRSSPPPDVERDADLHMRLEMGYDPLDLSAAFAEQARESGPGAEDDEPGGKKRRVMAKVDVERLMGDTGFPALMRSAKRFKPRGKGHEAKDLRDILNLYQMWAHGMFPKGDFEGTIKRVETLCRTRRMEIAMKGYRDAFYPPPPRSPSPPGLSPLHTSPPLPAVDDVSGHISDGQGASSVSGEPREADGRSSARRLFDAGPDDGPDFDELLAMEQMEREQAHGPDPSANTAPAPARLAPDEEDEWEGLYD